MGGLSLATKGMLCRRGELISSAMIRKEEELPKPFVKVVKVLDIDENEIQPVKENISIKTVKEIEVEKESIKESIKVKSIKIFDGDE